MDECKQLGDERLEPTHVPAAGIRRVLHLKLHLHVDTYFLSFLRIHHRVVYVRNTNVGDLPASIYTTDIKSALKC